MIQKFKERTTLPNQRWLHYLNPIERLGEIEEHSGLKLIARGPVDTFIGESCEILDLNNKVLMHAEVLAFNKTKVFLMPFTKGIIRKGYKVRALGHGMLIPIGDALFGRVVDAFAKPIDNLGPIYCKDSTSIYKQAINPLDRQAIDLRINTGIHAIDSLLPLGKGSRIGLFAGSGVGKSVLLGMIIRNIVTDVKVIALIGERGREVLAFIQENFNTKTLSGSIIVVACSDESALMRKQAVFTATAIAEYFCSQCLDVMLFMDSITRFAMAQREISLSLGEPPTARGYTPSVFSLLPEFIERAGNFKEQGSITALYTVLVEGDDFNEPIADNLRALLDGHIILSRELIERGHYPAIDILKSISRCSKQLLNKDEKQLQQKIISLLSKYNQHKDLIEIGAYKQGVNPKLDYAVLRIDAINQLLIQPDDESLTKINLFEKFKEILQ